MGAVIHYIMAFPEKAKERAEAGPDVLAHDTSMPGCFCLTGKVSFRRAAGACARLDPTAQCTFDSNDQDVLNVAFQGVWLRCHSAGTCRRECCPSFRSGLIHFTGRRKPWQHSINWVHRKFAGQYSRTFSEQNPMVAVLRMPLSRTPTWATRFVCREYRRRAGESAKSQISISRAACARRMLVADR